MILKQNPETGWWTLGTGMDEGYFVKNMHPITACEGRGCGMHNKPTLHPLYNAPIRWTGILSRKCKHGIWHADRDEVLFYESRGRERLCGDDMNEDCDGCCEVWNYDE